MAWYQWQGDTLILRLRLQPGASRDAVLGPWGADSLRVAVQAPPVDGKANKRLQRFVAKAFDTAPRQVKLLGGEHCRDKRLAVDGPQRLPEDWGIEAKPV